jgi:hypothetical protein
MNLFGAAPTLAGALGPDVHIGGSRVCRGHGPETLGDHL